MVEALVAVADALVRHCAKRLGRLYAAAIQRKIRHCRVNRWHIGFRCAVVSYRTGDENELSKPDALLQRAARADANRRLHANVVELFDCDPGGAAADAGRKREHVYALVPPAQAAELAVIRQLLHVLQLFCDAVESGRVARENRVANAERFIKTNVRLFHDRHPFVFVRLFLPILQDSSPGNKSRASLRVHPDAKTAGHTRPRPCF